MTGVGSQVASSAAEVEAALGDGSAVDRGIIPTVLRTVNRVPGGS